MKRFSRIYGKGKDNVKPLSSLKNKSTCEVSKEEKGLGANHVVPPIAKVLATLWGTGNSIPSGNSHRVGCSVNSLVQ